LFDLIFKKKNYLLVSGYTKCRNKVLLSWLTITKRSTYVLAQKGIIAQMHILNRSIAVSANHQFGHCRSKGTQFKILIKRYNFPYQWLGCFVL